MTKLKTLVVLTVWVLAGVTVVSGETFRTGSFIQGWLLLGPVPVGEPEDAQNGLLPAGALDRDYLLQLGGETNVAPRAGVVLQSEGRDYLWRAASGATDVVEFGVEEGEIDPSVAYAWTEVVTVAETNAFMTLGGTGALKLWLNDRVVLERAIARPMRRDDEVFAVSLRRGTNRFLLKLQTQTSTCSFAARFLGRPGVVSLLTEAAGTGDLRAVRNLLSLRVDVHSTGPSGLTPWWAARIHGYDEVMAYLESKGADANGLLPPVGRVIDGMMQSRVPVGSPGAVILVSRYGKVVFENGYGYASLQHKVPVTPRTVFALGGVIEPFTAAAVLMLRDQEKLRVTDTLDRFLPDFPWGKEITVNHLLSHMSGLHNYSDALTEFSGARLGPSELIAGIGRAPLDFSPGEDWRRSDSDYLVLGHLVERISGVTFGQFLRSGIFGPLSMTNTAVHDWSAVIDHDASGYAYKDGGFRKAVGQGGLWWSGGVLRSTVRDLHVWTEALFAGDLLKKSTVKASLTPVRLSDGKKPLNSPGYGYGWIVTETRGQDLIQNGGGADGFQSVIARYPEEELTVVVLVNCWPAPPGLDAASLASEIGQLFLYDRMEPRKTPSS